MITCKKIEDFKLKVENKDGQYIRSNFINNSEENYSNRIEFRIHMGEHVSFRIELTREDMKNLAELASEIAKQL